MTRRLCLLDVDSALLTSDILESLAETAGTRETVAGIAEAIESGECDDAEGLARQAATLKGLPESVFDQALTTVRLTPGAQNLVETLHGRGWVVGLVSGGFVEVVGPLAARLGITRFRANGLESVNGVLTGRTSGPIVDRAARAQALLDFSEAEGVAIGDTVAVGGRASDLDMLNAAGLGIAFNGTPIVEESADVVITSTRLDAVLDSLAEEAIGD